MSDEEDVVWLRRAPQRTRFSVIFEFGVLISLCLGAVYICLHFFSSAQYLSTVAAGYEGGRMWKDNEPPRSRESYSLEARLTQDLDAYEQERRPGLDSSWQKIIWQSWKNEDLTGWTDSWKDLNPDWDYRFLLDSQVDEIVFDTFSGVPDLIDTWKAYPKNVLRFDLFRYLFPWAFGGLYADADTTCTQPITYWLAPEMWNETSIHTVIGLEFDGPRDWVSWNRAIDYVQYMMLSKPFSPIMKAAVIETIVRSHRLKEYQNVATLADVDWSFFNVLKTTCLYLHYAR